jgi:hypothetical protein
MSSFIHLNPPHVFEPLSRQGKEGIKVAGPQTHRETKSREKNGQNFITKATWRLASALVEEASASLWSSPAKASD